MNRRIAACLLAVVLPCHDAAADEPAMGAKAARPWADAHLEPLALTGQTLQEAFERLSGLGFSCNVGFSPSLDCRAPKAAVPAPCEALVVSVPSTDPPLPTGRNTAASIAHVLDLPARAAWATCVPDLSSDGAQFLPPASTAADLVRTAARDLARGAPDLRSLALSALATRAHCSLASQGGAARLTCTGGQLESRDCTQAEATFEAVSLRGATPALTAWTCTRGAHVEVPPSPDDHDRWAELGVFAVAQLCAAQDAAWRSSKPLALAYAGRETPDWAAMDASPAGRCVHERHWAPDGLCRRAAQVDLTDGRQAKAFIKDNQSDLQGLEPRLNAYAKLRLERGDVACPRP